MLDKHVVPGCKRKLCDVFSLYRAKVKIWIDECLGSKVEWLIVQASKARQIGKAIVASVGENIINKKYMAIFLDIQDGGIFLNTL